MYKIKEKKIENVILYLRVSSQEQVDFGNSLESQKSVCTAFF